MKCVCVCVVDGHAGEKHALTGFGQGMEIRGKGGIGGGLGGVLGPLKQHTLTGFD